MKTYLFTNEKTATKLAKTDKCRAQGKQNKFTVYKWFADLSEMAKFNKENNFNFKECNKM